MVTGTRRPGNRNIARHRVAPPTFEWYRLSHWEGCCPIPCGVCLAGGCRPNPVSHSTWRSDGTSAPKPRQYCSDPLVHQIWATGRSFPILSNDNNHEVGSYDGRTTGDVIPGASCLAFGREMYTWDHSMARSVAPQPCGENLDTHPTRLGVIERSEASFYCCFAGA